MLNLDFFHDFAAHENPRHLWPSVYAASEAFCRIWLDMSNMKRLADKAIAQYNNLVLNRPILVIIILMMVIAVLGYKAGDFKIDASAETLLLENDADLHFTRQVNRRYGVSDFLVISYAPRDGRLLDQKNLDHLGRLRDELKGLSRVSSVLTILDVPLLQSPPINYDEFSGNLPTLASPNTDRTMAGTELQKSDFYRDLIVSSDLLTTALVVNLKGNDLYQDLIEQRRVLREKKMPKTVWHRRKKCSWFEYKNRSVASRTLHGWLSMKPYWPSDPSWINTAVGQTFSWEAPP
jgi:predicted RND superfamily exporter protein